MYLWIMYCPISKHGWAYNVTIMTPTMKTMCSIGSLLQLSATSFHRYMSGSVLESFRTFWSTDFSIALVLCWFRNYPSSESSDHGDNGPFWGPSARVSMCHRCSLVPWWYVLSYASSGWAMMDHRDAWTNGRKRSFVLDFARRLCVFTGYWGRTLNTTISRPQTQVLHARKWQKVDRNVRDILWHIY